jgi:hypothetical protein
VYNYCIKKTKTAFIWVFIIIDVVDIIFNFLALFAGPYKSYGILGYVGYLLGIVSLIISVIWLYQAFLLKKNLIKWTNISFGMSIFILFFEMLVFPYSGDPSGAQLAMLSNLFVIVVCIIVWILFVKHIKKAIITNRIQLD